MTNNFFRIEANNLLVLLQKKYGSQIQKKIKIKNLIVLVEFVSLYKPKSKIKEEEAMILQYLEILNNTDLNTTKKNDLLVLQQRFIYPTINRFMKFGFRYKFAWIYTLLFIIALDYLICFFSNRFIPFFSVIFIIVQSKKEIIAFKENKLW